MKEKSSDKLEMLLHMAEHPEDYSDEQLEKMMADQEMHAYYELMVQAEQGLKLEAGGRRRRLSAFASRQKVAATIISVLLSGVAIGAVVLFENKREGREQEEIHQVEDSQKFSKAFDGSQRPSTPTDTLVIKAFENIELETMLAEMGVYYDVHVDFRNQQARKLRFFYEWNRHTPLGQIIETLNKFEQVDITLHGDTIVIY